MRKHPLTSHRSRLRRTARPCLNALESRIAPASFAASPGSDTLRAAIGAALSSPDASNEVLLSQGDYKLTQDGGGEVLIQGGSSGPHKTLTLVGAGASADGTRVLGSGVSRVF